MAAPHVAIGCAPPPAPTGPGAKRRGGCATLVLPASYADATHADTMRARHWCTVDHTAVAVCSRWWPAVSLVELLVTLPTTDRPHRLVYGLDADDEAELVAAVVVAAPIRLLDLPLRAQQSIVAFLPRREHLGGGCSNRRTGIDEQRSPRYTCKAMNALCCSEPMSCVLELWWEQLCRMYERDGFASRPVLNCTLSYEGPAFVDRVRTRAVDVADAILARRPALRRLVINTPPGAYFRSVLALALLDALTARHPGVAVDGLSIADRCSTCPNTEVAVVKKPLAPVRGEGHFGWYGVCVWCRYKLGCGARAERTGHIQPGPCGIPPSPCPCKHR